ARRGRGGGPRGGAGKQGKRVPPSCPCRRPVLGLAAHHSGCYRRARCRASAGAGEMGISTVRARIRRAPRERALAVRFLVDTGAVYTVLPSRVWRKLGHRPLRSAEFTLADGSTI